MKWFPASRPILLEKQQPPYAINQRTSVAALDLDALNAAIDALVAHYGARLWRCKGIVLAEGRRSRLVVQGVQGLVQISGGTLWRPFQQRRSVLVFIGQGLDTDRILAVMKACESAAAPAAG